jgi:hypothetical protein
MAEMYRFYCPECDKRIKAEPSHAGKKGRCPKCGLSLIIPPPPEEEFEVVQVSPPPAPAAAVPDAGMEELLAYLRANRPADIDGVKDAGTFANVLRYYEEVVADPAAPKLVYYALEAKGIGVTFPFLVVVTGERAEHDKAWFFNFEPILKRALPGKGWSAVSRDGYANFSKPGCQLASTAPFDRIAAAITKGEYELVRVLKAAAVAKPEPSAPKPRSGPVNVQELTEELARLVGADGGFGNCDRIRAIGEDLNRAGGMNLMQTAFYAVRRSGVYFSQDIWDGIGGWRA